MVKENRTISTVDVHNKIYQTALSDGMPQNIAHYMVAQAIVETGNFTHRFFKVGNNAFGYSYYKGSKYQIAPGDKADNKQPIAQYRTIEDSVHEVTSWIKRRQAEKKLPSDLTTITTPYMYGSLMNIAKYGGLSPSHYGNAIQAAIKKVK